MTNTHKRKLFQTLVRWFIFAGVIATAVSLLVYSIFTYQSFKKFAYQNLISSRDQQILLINTWFQEKSEDIKQLSYYKCVKDADLSGMNDLFVNYMEDIHLEFDNLFYAGIDGKIKMDAHNDAENIDISDRMYYLAALQGRPFISGILTSRENGAKVVVVSAPVAGEDGKFHGLVAGTLSLQRIDQFISSFWVGNTGETYLVNKEGIMLTESRFTSSLVKKGLIKGSTKYTYKVESQGVNSLIGGESGTGEYTNYRGKKVLGAYQWLPERDWGLMVEIERNEILGSWIDKIFVLVIIFLFLTVLIIYPLAVYLSGRIIRPITGLAKRVDSYAENYRSGTLSWTAIKDQSFEEIDVLAQAFYRMSEEMGQLMENLEKQARYDSLTGLANRRSFYEKGEEIVELAQRTQTPFTLLFVDIDRFKAFNDTFGHSVGDEVLIKLARTITQNIRINDVAGRLGGEEFAILLPGTDLEGAFLLAERLRKAVEETPIEVQEKILFLTISLGIAKYDLQKGRINALKQLEKVIKEADIAMYMAKEMGRNRVEIYSYESDKN